VRNAHEFGQPARHAWCERAQNDNERRTLLPGRRCPDDARKRVLLDRIAGYLYLFMTIF
jgi:hypothetical protein